MANQVGFHYTDGRVIWKHGISYKHTYLPTSLRTYPPSTAPPPTHMDVHVRHLLTHSKQRTLCYTGGV